MGDDHQKQDDLVGRVLAGRYRLGKRLGEGGMGAVYEAIHIQLGRRVAVKTLLEITDPTDVARLHDEAMTAAALTHPCIVQVTDFGPATDDAPPFLVMELLPGESLAGLLEREGKLPLERALPITTQLLSALGVAHEGRVLHRDVKPSNVFLTTGVDGSAPMVKVVDFGIARFLDDTSRRTTTGKVIGTLAYMAPEVLRGQPPSAAADLYAVGVVLFEMLTGKRPFDVRRKDLVEAVVREEAPDPRTIEPSIPKAVADVVLRALRKKPELRFDSAKAMADALRAAANAPSGELALTIGPSKNAKTSNPQAIAEPRTSPPSADAPRSASVFTIAALASIAIGAVVIAIVAVRYVLLAPPPARPPATPVAASAPSLSTTAEPASSDAASSNGESPPVTTPTAAPPATKVASICFAKDGGYLCPKLQRRCTCKSNDGFVLAKNVCTESKGCLLEYYVGFDAKPVAHDACSGYYVTYSPDGKATEKPGVGDLECSAQCNKVVARQEAVLASPGTPCEGFAYESTKVKGVWKPIPEGFGL